MLNNLLHLIEISTLASSAAIAIVLLSRNAMRSRFGALAAYALWALVPLAAAAALLPARVVTIVSTALPAVTQVQATAAPTVTMPVVQPIDWTPLVALLWLLGVAAALFAFIRQQRRFVRSLGRLVPIDADALRAETSAGCPALVGALRPRVVLPVDFEQRYSITERALILAHERNHRQRGDAQINALAAALRCLFWFNPLVHLAATRFRFDQELACDAVVIARFPNERRSYADAMLKTQLASFGLPIGCQWQSSHPLKERIAMLKRPLPGRVRAALGMLIVSVLIGGGAFAAWAGQPARINLGESKHYDVQIEYKFSLDNVVIEDTANGFSHTDTAGWKVEGQTAGGIRTVPPSGIRYISAYGQPFSITARKGDETWMVQGTATRGTGDNVTFNAVFSHNGSLVSEPEVSAVFGQRSALQVGEKDATGVSKGARFDFTILRAVPLPGFNAVEGTSAGDEAATAQKLSDEEAVLGGPDDAPSEKIALRKATAPHYPAQAVKDHVQGKVVVKVLVDDTGVAKSAEVVSIDPPSATILGNAAVATAMQWQFNPGRKDGKSIGGYVLVPVDFSLTKDDGSAEATAEESSVVNASYRNLRPPIYPDYAVKQKIAGTLYMQVNLGADGSVAEVFAMHAAPRSALAFADSAVTSLKTWRFSPRTVDGVSTPSTVIVPVQYALKGAAPPAIKEPVPSLPEGAVMLDTIKIQGG